MGTRYLGDVVCLRKNTGVITAEDGLEGGLLRGGMLLLSRWLSIVALRLRTLPISRPRADMTRDVGGRGMHRFCRRKK